MSLFSMLFFFFYGLGSPLLSMVLSPSGLFLFDSFFLSLKQGKKVLFLTPLKHSSSHRYYLFSLNNLFVTISFIYYVLLSYREYLRWLICTLELKMSRGKTKEGFIGCNWSEIRCKIHIVRVFWCWHG